MPTREPCCGDARRSTPRPTPAVTATLAGLLALAAALRAAAAPPTVPPDDARVVEVSPQGTVKQVHQVTVRFSRAMVALGDPRAASDPVTLECGPAAVADAATGRWLDSRTFVLDLARPLGGGVRCSVALRAGLVDLAGHPIGGEQRFAFSTGGPSILTSRPSDGSEIAEDQAFVLALDAEATAASVEGHAYFAADGVAERIPVTIASPEIRAAILATDPDWRPEGSILVLQARQRFPADAGVRLVWGRGVESTSGIATDQDQTLEYRTRPAFRAEIRCERENPRAGCVPLAPIVLRFTAPVAADAAARVALVAPDGTRFAQQPPDTPDPQVTRATFPGPFPASSTLHFEVPADLRDDSGRPLANAGEMRSLPVAVDPVPPLAKLAARFGIVEAKADPALPVTIRGLEPKVATRLLELAHMPADPPSAGSKPAARGTVVRLASDRPADLIPWLRRVAGARRDRSVFAGTGVQHDLRSFDLPQPLGPEMQVVGIPFERPGVYVVELASRRLGQVLLDADAPMYVPGAALVTDLAVHFEWGRERSLVWVTTLEKARPVADAQVAVHDCAGKVLWQGRTDASGLAWIASLPTDLELPTCRAPESEGGPDPYGNDTESQGLSGLGSGLLVTARLGDDLSFVHSSWNDGIEPFRFNLPGDSYQRPYAAHTVLARALLRAGDTAYMKHVFRAETLAGFALATPEQRPSRLLIRHVGSGAEVELPLEWADDGSAETAWPVPREAKLGRYEVVLARPGSGEDGDEGEGSPAAGATGAAARPTPTPAPPYLHMGRTESFPRQWVAGEFRVEEFRVPLLRTAVKLPAGPQVAPRELPVDLAVSYLAGGGASGLPVTVRSRLLPVEVEPPPELEGFRFANGAVETGITRRGPGEGEADQPDAATDASGPGTRAVLRREELRLDAAGTARATIAGLPAPKRPEKLLVEVELRDPNGEAQTASAKAILWPAARLVGLKADFRRDEKRRITADVAVIDVQRKPVAGVAVVVEAFERLVYTNRQRVAGGFYAYQDVEEIRRLKTLCRGRTGGNGLLSCRRRAPADGDLLVQARIVDDLGRASAAHADVWVPGPRDAWFRMADSDRMDVVPEKRRYQAGETARLQVRMPFRRATALVTTGREGVLEARVVELSGKDPSVEVPVGASFAPNMFVQVLAVRGRVGGIQPTALVDLGKPAFKVGIAELEVGWKPHQLEVAVTPEREVYATRDRARVEIAVRPASSGPLPEGATAAVFAVDEGLLELLPNPSVELLRAMMGRRGYAVETSTAQMQVVGKRHFGKKALAPGGGGGRQVTRELFDTLLLWSARVPLDAAGHATVEVPLNDSLTSFRIVAVATAGTGLFGTGEATIRATQDLMLLSGLPPLVRSGDRFRAAVTVRNTTAGPLEVAVSGRAAGLSPPDLPAQDVRLAAGEARVVDWEVAVPAGVDRIAYQIEAAARGGPRDRLAVEQRVVPAVPVRTLQATLTQWSGPDAIVEKLARPAGALPDLGGVEVGLAPSLAGGLAAVRDWMRAYPYDCLEQRVSRAVALGDPAAWAEVASLLPSYQDGDGLLKFFPSMPWGSESLTAYVLSLAHAASLALPTAAEESMQRGLRSFVDGSLARRTAGLAPDLPLRKLAAIAALAGAGADDPQLLSGITIEPELWPTSAVLDWWSIALRMSSLPDRTERRGDAERILRARLNLEGTLLAFTTQAGVQGAGNPFGGEDADALRLVLLALESGAWRDLQPRLMRGALARQRAGRWDTTVANAWGAVATTRFARTFESGPVTGETVATLAGQRQALDWGHDPQGGRLDFSWPPDPADLAVLHHGTGRPWLTIRSRAALPLAAPLANGYRIRRSTTPIEQRVPGRWSVGDTMRLRLEIDAAADLAWVVVDDPVPAGASYLARGFATDSAIAAANATGNDAGSARGGASSDARAVAPSVAPTHEERSFEAYRAYFERVPAGRFAVEYAIRLNQAGTLQLGPTHVEALYAPEVMGEVPNGAIEVGG